jgi:hypothetical protein
VHESRQPPLFAGFPLAYPNRKDLPVELTALLAIYAAVLSSIVFAWNVSRARAKIQVRVVYCVQAAGKKYMHGASVSVQNPSAHTAHVTNISLVYPYKKVGLRERFAHLWRFKRLPHRIGWCHTSLRDHDVDDKCPISIQPGMAHSVFVPHNVIEKILKDATSRRFIAVAQDALWRDKYSNAFEYSASTAN